MTDIKIINNKFYINNIMANQGNHYSEGKLIGVYTDMCSFFDNNLLDVEHNKREFIKNLSIWQDFGVNLITVGFQGPNPFDEYYKKARERDKSQNISFNSSALKSDGSLEFDYLENAEEIIRAADHLNYIVLVNILSSSCEDIFEDEFAIINGIFNIIGWILKKNFSNIIVNITDVAHTFYKSSVLTGNGIIKILKSIKEKTKDKLIIGAGIKTFVSMSEKNICEYIKLSDFIPIYTNSVINTKSFHNTKKMIENIYFFKKIMRDTGRKIPIIMAKGDDLSDRHNSYGKNNLTEALENGISWCYYDRDGFVILKNQSIHWDKNSSPEKINFFETLENIK